ncbi:hypothetical protein [Halobellus ordinarius]|uniref:hypothetical protein n=1 Tax=Halobellus ordinarius TaxID=3075120 RepID=UPI0028809393|nr:hypothetical protein [Halobellus sp. ZY16]
MTDGDTAVPSDYDTDDGWTDDGLEQCPHCETTLAPQTGKHAPVYDGRGRKFDTIYDTDPNNGPFYCADCWPELEANQKASENQSLGRFATDGGEVIAVSPLTGVIYAASEYSEAGDWQIIAEDKRPLPRAEIAERLDEVHGPVRLYYEEHLGGDSDD